MHIWSLVYSACRGTLISTFHNMQAQSGTHMMTDEFLVKGSVSGRRIKTINCTLSFFFTGFDLFDSVGYEDRQKRKVQHWGESRLLKRGGGVVANVL